MFDLTKIEPVKLAHGSHSSASDGLCFMEMVAWFEGENHSDHPDCACPVLTAYGININDAMPDDLRNDLLRPLVPLMAGTRSTVDEQKRSAFLAMWSVNKILPIILREQGMAEHALNCERAGNLAEAKTAANAGAAKAAAATAAATATANAAVYAAAADAANATAAANAAANAAVYATAAANAARYATAYAAYAADAASTATAAVVIWRVAVEGLRQAILIGRHDGFTAMTDVVFAQRADRLLEIA